MSQTNTDYLLQVIAPVPDRNSSSSRNSDDAPEFGQHLSEASASVCDIAQPASRGNPSSFKSTSDKSSSNSSYERYVSGPSAKPADPASCRTDGSSPSGQSSTQDQPIEQVGDASEATCRDDDNQHAADKPSNEDVAAVATVAVAAGKNAPRKTATLTHKADSDSAKPVKANASSDEAAHRAAKRVAKTEGQAAKPDPQATEASAKLVAAAEGEAKADEAPPDGVDPVKPDEKGTTADKQAKHDQHAGALHAAAGTDNSVHGDKQSGKHQTSTEDNTADTSDSSEKVTSKAQSNANATSATAPTSSSDSDESSDDEPRRGSKTSARASSRNDAAVPINKSDVTAIANGVSANVPDVTTKNESASDASDAAAKPVAAKADVAALSPGRTMRANAEINRGDRAANANETPRVDPARFVGRVAKAFQTAHERGGTLQLRLSPPELGSMRLELTVKDGVMSAALETDNANARRVLLEHLPALRDRLAEQNIRVDRFDVDVRQENNGGQANPRGPHQQPHQQQQSENSGSRRATTTQQREREAVPLDVPLTAPRISSTGINLVV